MSAQWTHYDGTPQTLDELQGMLVRVEGIRAGITEWAVKRGLTPDELAKEVQQCDEAIVSLKAQICG